MKQCYTCKEVKPASEFYAHPTNKTGLQSSCKKCTKATATAWNTVNAEQKSSNRLLRIYGITLEQKIEMLALQNNCCALCGVLIEDVSSACVDHCHDSTNLRDILCHSCNVGLGHFKDSKEILQKAILYLDKHATENELTPVPTGHYPKSEEHTKHGTISSTGVRQDSNNPDNHWGTIPWKDINHRAQESSGDGVAHRNRKVEPSPALTRLEDNGDAEPEIVRLDFGGRRLFD